MSAKTLSATDVPKLLSSETTPALKTLYLDIDLGSSATGGTAVFIPDAAAVGGTVNVLLYFKGNQGNLTGRSGGRKNLDLTGLPLDKYMAVDEFKLRDFVVASGKKSFVLVVPSLDNGSNADIWTDGSSPVGDNSDAFLAQVLAGIQAHYSGGTGSKPALGKVVLAAHSGGGRALEAVVSRATTGTAGLDQKVEELWCFDCTYSGVKSGKTLSADALDKWATTPGHTLDRLWVVSTGSWDAKGVDPSKPISKDNPGDPKTRQGTGDNAQAVGKFGAKLGKAATPQTNIEVYDPSAGIELNWKYAKGPLSHNDLVGKYFAELVKTSANL